MLREREKKHQGQLLQQLLNIQVQIQRIRKQKMCRSRGLLKIYESGCLGNRVRRQKVFTEQNINYTARVKLCTYGRGTTFTAGNKTRKTRSCCLLTSQPGDGAQAELNWSAIIWRHLWATVFDSTVFIHSRCLQWLLEFRASWRENCLLTNQLISLHIESLNPLISEHFSHLLAPTGHQHDVSTLKVTWSFYTYR